LNEQASVPPGPLRASRNACETLDLSGSLAATAPNPIDLLEQEAVQSRRLENNLARARIKDVKADRALRKKYANRILKFLEIYPGTVGLFVIARCFKLGGFFLGKEVIATLVGSTAAAAIRLVGLIARGLFGPPEK
jgi:hypothetical protein